LWIFKQHNIIDFIILSTIPKSNKRVLFSETVNHYSVPTRSCIPLYTVYLRVSNFRYFHDLPFKSFYYAAWKIFVFVVKERLNDDNDILMFCTLVSGYYYPYYILYEFSYTDNFSTYVISEDHVNRTGKS